MQLKLFSFTKTEKNPIIIENKINSFLDEGKVFKFAAQSESTKSGKFFLSLFHEEGQAKIKAKVFKDSNVKNLESLVNDFLKEGHSMKWSSQSSSTSSIYLVLFYEPGKANVKEENKDQR